MSKVLHLQQTLHAPAAKVFHALTDSDALETWFAEHASVSLDERRYDFWGRFTPELPVRAEGRHEIQVVEPNRRLRYKWFLRNVDTTVELRLSERDGQTILGLWHRDVPGIPMGEPDCYSIDDLWIMWLENLRRYLDGRPLVRSDFSTSRVGDLALTVDIDGPASDVWEALTEPEQRNRWIASDATERAEVGGVWVDWGEGVGPLEILHMAPEREFSLGWNIEGVATVVTWTLEESAGKTRLTLAHSGFAEGRRSDGEWGGWLTYLSLIKSLVEYGAEWVPPLKELTKQVARYCAGVTWARQDELLEEADEEWGGG